MGRVAGLRGVVVASAVGLGSLGAAQQPAAVLPTSALPVTLIGVAMDGAAPSRSACLVRCTYPGDKETTRLLLTSGQRACDVAEITEIRPETVVIKNLLTNRLELLTFPKIGAALSKTAPATTEPGPAAPEPPAAAPGVERSPKVVTIEVRKEALERYLSNLPELLNSAVATPHYRDVGNGQSIIEGFEMSGIKEASAPGQLGLQNGDVVLEVNGGKLDSASSVVRLLGLLGQAQVLTQAKLIVLRNQERVTIVVNMK